MNKVIIALLLLVFTLEVTGQKRGFSDNREEFFEQLDEFVKDAKNKKLDESFELFEEFWISQSMGSNAESSFMQMADLMAKKRYRPNPDFRLLFDVTLSFYKNEQPEYNYTTFLNVLDTCIKTKVSRTDIIGYLEFFEHFNKTAQLNNAKGKTWSLSSTAYEIKFNKAPRIEVSNVDLKLGGKNDTLAIFGTDGKYHIFSNEWYGLGGEVTWERAGLSAGDVYAELKNYRLNTERIGYDADSVVFRNYEVYEQAMEGSLTDQIHNKGVKGPYPQFRSYQNSYTLSNLDEYMAYKGGFGMEGNTILGSGTKYNPARLTISKDGAKFMKLESRTFYIRPQSINTNETAVVTYLNNDSIIHPNLVLQLERESRYIKLSTSPSSLSQSPFYNTYHQLDMYADQMEVYLDSNYIDIRSVRDPDGRASFESTNFFSRKRFDKMQGQLAYNPLFKMNDLYALYQKRIYTEAEIAGFYDVEKIEQIQPLLLLLNMQGFIFYDPNKKEIALKDKLFTYINAYLRKIDYDVIQLNSVSRDKPNSRLDLENYNLDIRGIKTVKLSDSQNVQIYPYQQTITFLKNRDMEFDGYMRAGRFEYFGKGFDFNYEDFQISMKQIDSMMFNFPDKNYGNQLRRVNTVIQDITGNLKIDKPDNKSGRRHSPNYPIFDCYKGAFVYYDYKAVFNGVYDRERFYFKLKPFVVDSLDNFSMQGMNLDGMFVSANILPNFEYQLTLQPDFSLGFTKDTPEDGYPLYGGRGHGKMKMFLSNSGLRGKGEFTYNGAEITSENMLFFPDSMQALNTVFLMEDKERKKFPYVNSENCVLKWGPYADTMLVTANDSNAFINMYEPETFLKGGQLVFTKKNMYGKGEFNYKQGIMYSDNYNFKHRDLKADSASFNLYDDDMERVALSNTDTKIRIDFDKKELKGVANFDSVYTDLSINKYSTNIPEFTWKLEEEKVILEKGKNTSDVDFFFVSTNPVFDSLTFAPSSAELDLTTYDIDAFDIQYFLVADSKITPDSAVVISENGEIPELENAKILASAENEFHVVEDATVNIFSSKKFSATGKYKYVDPRGEVWNINMREVRSTDEGTTVGKGDIPDSMGFRFGPNMGFSGSLIFQSDRKDILFNGEVALEHKYRFELATQDFKFEGRVAFDSLFFRIDNAKNSFGQELHTGLFLNPKTKKTYALFMGLKQNPDDLELWRAEGDLFFAIDSNMFIITEPEKYIENAIAPEQWVYNTTDSAITMTGPLDFGYDIENFGFSFSGQINYDITSAKTEMFLSGGVDFPMQSDAVKVMGDSILNFGYFNLDANNMKTHVVSGVARNLEKQKDIDKMLNSVYGANIVPTYKGYEPLFLFSDTPLKWDSTSMSFTNTDQIGIANIGDIGVNKKLNGRLSLFQNESTDSLSIYLEGNAGNWYLFTFLEEELYIASSDNEFNERALDKKPKEVEGRLAYKKAEEAMIVETRKKVYRRKE